MTAALPLFDDPRDFADTRVHLHSYARVHPDEKPDTLLLIRGYGRAVRMSEKAARAFLSDREFIESNGIRARTVHHRDGTVSVLREWIGPHDTTARTTTRNS